MACALLLTACGPDIGDLAKGEEGRVVAAFNGDGLELDSGLRVFLAEVDAPRGDAPYAAQAQGELESLVLHRNVRLAYGGTRRWVRRGEPREGEEPAPETAIAHVYVQSEGGRWFWLQHELVSRGAAFVRPRADNNTRTPQLLAIEAQARADQRGLWRDRGYRVLNAAAAADAALAADINCLRAAAPYRLVEARVAAAQTFDRRAALVLDADEGFTLVVFGESFANWNGDPFASYEGKRIRVRGALGVYYERPQICVDDAGQIEVLADNSATSSSR